MPAIPSAEAPMKRITVPALAFAVLGAALAALPPTPGDPPPAACTAPPEWFPPENIKRPDFTAPEIGHNCEFHKWAWKTFLWLTQATGGGRIRLMDLPTAADLFLPGRGPVEAKLLPKDEPLMLSPRVAKTADPTHFGDIRQAGAKGVLVDQKGRAVYYATHFSPEFYNFVRMYNLFTLEGYRKADKGLSFPVASLEIKSAWRVVGPGEDAAGLYTTTAYVHPIACKNGKDGCTGEDVVVDLSRAEKVTAALVGVHVVGRVEQHPEFVWATFEHDGNAPDLPANLKPDSPQPVAGRDYTFYKAGTAAADCNRLNRDDLTADVKAKTLSPITHVFRQYAWGGGDDGDRRAVQELDDSVHKQLATAAKDSVWRNYSLIGSVWFKAKDALKPDLTGSAIQDLATGSTRLSNATMETFTQNLARNCFVCHNVSGTEADKNINLSHAILNAVIQRKEATQFASRAPGPIKTLGKLASFKEVQELLNGFVAENDVPIGQAPYRDFWNATPDGPMTYEKFIAGDLPGVADPETGKPLNILVKKDAAHSNLILALRGEGPLFDPVTGTVGRMPPTGPFLPDDEIKLLAEWIDAGCPNGP
jgi:hypothetical protein